MDSLGGPFFCPLCLCPCVQSQAQKDMVWCGGTWAACTELSHGLTDQVRLSVSQAWPDWTLQSSGAADVSGHMSAAIWSYLQKTDRRWSYFPSVLRIGKDHMETDRRLPIEESGTVFVATLHSGADRTCCPPAKWGSVSDPQLSKRNPLHGGTRVTGVYLYSTLWDELECQLWGLLIQPDLTKIFWKIVCKPILNLVESLPREWRLLFF